MILNFNMELVSIYILNKNYREYLDQAIQSVLNQTYKSFELLVFDDNSDDGSKEYLRELSKRIGFTYFEKNQNFGLVKLANEALNYCRGEYIIRLDADDYLEPSAIEKLVHQASRQNSDVTFGNYIEVSANGEHIRTVIRHNFNAEISLKDEPAHGAVTLIRVSFLKSIHGYQENFYCQDGYYLWLSALSSNATISNVEDVLFSYRRHNLNLTSDEFLIYSTRRQIKREFVRNEGFIRSAIVVSFIRGNASHINEFWLNPCGIKSYLEIIVRKIISEQSVGRVILVVDGMDQLKLLESKFQMESVKVLLRPKVLSDFDLNELLQSLMSSEDFRGLHYLVNYNLDYPIFTRGYIDEAVMNHILFNADSVVSARYDDKAIFQHNGKSLVQINTKKGEFQKEEEVYYRHIGGLLSVRVDSFIKSRKILTGVISHIFADELSAFFVNSHFTYRIAKEKLEVS